MRLYSAVEGMETYTEVDLSRLQTSNINSLHVEGVGIEEMSMNWTWRREGRERRVHQSRVAEG